jgi:hypothetical protein
MLTAFSTALAAGLRRKTLLKGLLPAVSEVSTKALVETGAAAKVVVFMAVPLKNKVSGLLLSIRCIAFRYVIRPIHNIFNLI